MMTETPSLLWHGGAPDLRPGDTLDGNHERKIHDGCPWCAAREAERAGGPRPLIDGLSRNTGVYMTTERLYAKCYASLYGRGDLYRVEPIDTPQRSTEDTFPTWWSPAARIVAVVDRAVLLTPSERRRLQRDWARADAAAVGAMRA